MQDRQADKERQKNSLLRCYLLPNTLHKMPRSIFLWYYQLSPAFVQDIQWQYVKAKGREKQIMH